MRLPTTGIPSTSDLHAILKAPRHAQTPTRLTHKFSETLGFSSDTNSTAISVFKARVCVVSGYLPGQREVSTAACRKRGFDLVLYPIAPVFVSLGALERLYRPLTENDCLPHDHIDFDVSEIPEIQLLAKKLLGSDALIALEEQRNIATVSRVRQTR